MIRINLAPIDELENKFWYLPDVMTIVLVLSLSFLSEKYYLTTVEEEISGINNTTEDFNKNTQRLKPDLMRFEQLNKQVADLKEKLRSLEKITVSKIVRYKPVILLEHLQTLKPEGVWFSYIQDDSENSVLHVAGGAFDNILVSEFMSALDATRYQTTEENNPRNQVYFKNIFLEQVSSVTNTASSSKKENKKKEKDLNVQKAFDALKDSALEDTKSTGHARDSLKLFPEMSSFPAFELNLKYAERNGEPQVLELKNKMQTKEGSK